MYCIMAYNVRHGETYKPELKRRTKQLTPIVTRQ